MPLFLPKLCYSFIHSFNIIFVLFFLKLKIFNVAYIKIGHEKSRRMDCINKSWNMATISRFGPTVMVIRSPKVWNTYLWYLICSAMSFICTYVLNKHRKGINEIKKQHFECKVHLLHSVNHLAYQNCDHELQIVHWNQTSDNGTGRFVTTKVS